MRHTFPFPTIISAMSGKCSIEALYDAALTLEDVVVKPECGLCCEEIGFGEEFSCCGHGHIVCKKCLLNYVKKTLVPVHIVWLDNVRCCVDSDCREFYKRKELSACLSQILEKSKN